VQFMITADSGESVKVEAENWMAAMSKAMAFFDVSPEAMARWACTPGADGSTMIRDSAVDHSWLVEPVHSELKVVVAASSQREEVEEVAAPEPGPVQVQGAPPTLHMPATSLRRDPEPGSDEWLAGGAEQVDEDEEFFAADSLAERLFDLSMDLASATPAQACRLALDIILELVPCEAASVVRASLNDVQLTFVAASGPVADDLIGKRMPFGRGLVGLCFDTGMTVVVNDVTKDSRHFSRFDSETGFETRAVLTVAIDNEYGSYGAIQLLNPDRPFESRHVEVVEMVAQSLAGALAGAH